MTFVQEARDMRGWIHACMMVAGVAGVLGCGGGAPSPHENLTSVDPLRSAFNAESGKVRAIFLASPT